METPNANFKPNTTGDARVLFTSTDDNSATTSFFDPLTGTVNHGRGGAQRPQFTRGNGPDSGLVGRHQLPVRVSGHV